MPSRVLLIAPQPFYTARGTPMNVLQMCRALSHGGYHVDLATYPLGETVELPGLRIFRAPRLPGIHSVPIGFSVRKLALDIALGLRVAERLLRERYVAVHAVEEAVFLALPAVFLGTPLVYDLDSQLSEQLAYGGTIRSPWLLRGVRSLERFALRRSRAAITVCRSLTIAAKKLCPEAEIFQIEDAPLEESLLDPDDQRVAELRRELRLEDRPIVVYTGNLERYQGIELLLESAEVLRMQMPDVAFLLVGGDTGGVARLQAELTLRGLDSNVIAVGPRPPEQMADWMGLADVLISPRIHGDNTPLKLYTYMRSGRPIVATALVTHTQVLDGTTAILCAPDAASMADGLLRALKGGDEVRALGTRARELAETQYSPEAFRFKLLSAYASLFGAPSSPQTAG